MLRQVATANALKLSLAVTCPVAGTVALSLALPPVRAAVHRATSPRQYAKAKVRERVADTFATPLAKSCPALDPFSLSALPSMMPSLTQTIVPDLTPDDSIAGVASSIVAPFSPYSGTRYSSYSGTPISPYSGVRTTQPLQQIADRNTLVGDFEVTDTRVDGFIANVESDVIVSAAPEPETWVQLLLGFGVIGFAMRRMRRSYERDIRPA